jgi:GAF domain-containing protein
MTELPHSASPSETVEFDAFLRQIAESALALSGASGCAIAIRNGADRSGEEIFCVARSGGTAPPLGSRLDANSGISGECILTGHVLHCDDTATDHRVDPEVCRELGLRSMVVLPVRGQRRTAGILEVFSTRPHAFTGGHINSLKHLTEIIEMACASNSGETAAVARPDSTFAATGVSSGADRAEPAPRTWTNIHFPFPLSFLKDRRDYWIAGGGLAMLLLFALIGINSTLQRMRMDQNRLHNRRRNPRHRNRPRLNFKIRRVRAKSGNQIREMSAIDCRPRLRLKCFPAVRVQRLTLQGLGRRLRLRRPTPIPIPSKRPPFRWLRTRTRRKIY